MQTLELAGGGLAAGQRLRLENTFEAKCRFLVAFFFVARLARLLASFARSAIFGHCRSSQVLEQKNGLSPSIDKSRKSVLHAFPRANIAGTQTEQANQYSIE